MIVLSSSDFKEALLPRGAGNQWLEDPVLGGVIAAHLASDRRGLIHAAKAKPLCCLFLLLFHLLFLHK
jgi:hypothetical protein